MSEPRLDLKVATADDAAEILRLVRSAYRGEASRQGWTTEADLVADERIDHAGVLAKINAPRGGVLTARDEQGQLVGCCEVAARDDSNDSDGGGGGGSSLAYFGLFAIDPRQQARGLGRRVLAFAEEHARRAWGVGRIEMHVIWTRDELIAWYARRGYVRTGDTRPFPYHELVNGKALRDDLHFVILAKDLGRGPTSAAGAGPGAVSEAEAEAQRGEQGTPVVGGKGGPRVALLGEQVPPAQ